MSPITQINLTTSPEKHPITSKNTILVTGGCGFLGSHIVSAFTSDPHNTVIAISRNPSRHLVPGVTYLKCDINDHSAISTLLEQEAEHHHPAPRLPFYEKYSGPREKLGYVQALVYTGSALAVSNSSGLRSTGLTEEEAVMHTETSSPDPYSRNKAASDTLVLGANTRLSKTEDNPITNDFQGCLHTAVIRVRGIYGPRDSSIIPGILKIANSFATRIQFGDNVPVHEWVYVESCARAHVLVAKALLDRQRGEDLAVGGEAFFVTDGTPMKFWDFSRKIWKYAGDEKGAQGYGIIKVPWWIVIAMAAVTEWVCWILTFGRMIPPFSLHHVAYMRKGAWFSIEKAEKRLRYTPLVDTDEGIRRAVEWFQKEGNGGGGKRSG